MPDPKVEPICGNTQQHAEERHPAVGYMTHAGDEHDRQWLIHLPDGNRRIEWPDLYLCKDCAAPYVGNLPRDWELHELESSGKEETEVSNQETAKELPEFCEINVSHAFEQVAATHEVNEDNLKAAGGSWMKQGLLRWKPDKTKRTYDDFGYIYMCADCVKAYQVQKIAVPVVAEAQDPMSPQEFTAQKRKWVKTAPEKMFVCEVTPSGKRGAKGQCTNRAAYTVPADRSSNPDTSYPITGEALFICNAHALTLRVATGGFGGESMASTQDLDIVFDVE
jgi:hypothetical protein